VLERKAPPTFDVLIEIQSKNALAVHHRVAEVVDRFLRGAAPRPERRLRTGDGEVEIRPPESGGEARGQRRAGDDGAAYAALAPSGRSATGPPRGRAHPLGLPWHRHKPTRNPPPVNRRTPHRHPLSRLLPACRPACSVPICCAASSG